MGGGEAEGCGILGHWGSLAATSSLSLSLSFSGLGPESGLLYLPWPVVSCLPLPFLLLFLFSSFSFEQVLGVSEGLEAGLPVSAVVETFISSQGFQPPSHAM